MTELLVGTKKGLFVLRGDAGAEKPFDVAARAFPGNVVEFAIRDPRSGRYFASVTSGHFGPRVMHTMDPTGEWKRRSASDTRRAATGAWNGSGRSTRRGRGPDVRGRRAGRAIHLQRRRDDLGAEPGAVRPAQPLVVAAGRRWALPPLDRHVAGRPLAARDGISAVGVWLSEDGGASWRHGNQGLVPRYIPEEAREGTIDLCVHNMHRAPLRPERLFMQFHGGVYRSDDAGETWIESPRDSGGLRSLMAIVPADADSAFA